MTSFVSPFLGTSVATNRRAVLCTRPTSYRTYASVRATTDWDLGFDGIFHNEGSAWSGQGDMWVTFSGPPMPFQSEGGEDGDTVEYGDKTVLASDLCDLTGEGCGPGGVPPADAQKVIGKEVKPEPKTTEIAGRGFVDYSSRSTVFVDDDSISK